MSYMTTALNWRLWPDEIRWLLSSKACFKESLGSHHVYGVATGLKHFIWSSGVWMHIWPLGTEGERQHFQYNCNVPKTHKKTWCWFISAKDTMDATCDRSKPVRAQLQKSKQKEAPIRTCSIHKPDIQNKIWCHHDIHESYDKTCSCQPTALMLMALTTNSNVTRHRHTHGTDLVSPHDWLSDSSWQLANIHSQPNQNLRNCPVAQEERSIDANIIAIHHLSMLTGKANHEIWCEQRDRSSFQTFKIV